ncbi:aldose 1-epimerase [Polychaeton citri CBS 116435]|uniref:Aldose 1-epimerase n=1 Tax=Polychaeton citri CBS 116435 TaxID=1314669 RepID=A0A9P4UQZ7_9PEZI|nr:aldose 1-epimerase [Polychaeton citri CBS 116435]
MADSNWSDAVTFLPQGGIIQEFRVAGKNIVCGFRSAEPYKTQNTPYFGETIGRVANRISRAKIDNLNGKSYSLYPNNGANSMHGGAEGWGKKDFEGPTPINRDGKEAVLFKYLSKDGEEGYPGTVEFRLWYTPTLDKSDGADKINLEIEYEAELVGDEVEETVVALTNHSYFNISDGPTIEGTKATLVTNKHLPVDDNQIPTGSIKPYPEFEANKEFTFTADSPSPDHCFIVDEDASNIPLDTRGRELKKLCSFYHPSTKIHLEALSTEPAFQFYAGLHIDVPATDGAPALGSRAGFCIEASRYVNAINNDAWRNQVVLKKGQVWGARTTYRAWKE